MMTPKERAAMQQALVALEEIHVGNMTPMAEENWKKAITALREALAEQAEQKPVAWRVRGYNQFKTGNPAPWRYVDGADKPTVNKPDCCDFEPLYAAPVRTKDLTKTEMLTEAVEAGFMLHTGYGQGINKMMPVSDSATLVEFASAVIAADREKNNV